MSMTPILPATRIVRGAIAATLSHQFVDADGNAADPVGTVTVTVTRADGTELTGLSVSGTGTSPRTVTLTAAHVATVDWLTAEWAIDAVAVVTSVTEIVGGYLINEAQAKVVDPSVANAARFVDARKALEDTVTDELCRSPFERFYTERVDGTGTCDLYVAWPDVQGVTWAKTWINTTSTDLTATEIASVIAGDGRRMTRTDGKVWPVGHRNVEVGYRFGMRAIPSDLQDNLVMAIRWHLNKFSAGLPFLGETFTDANGTVMRTNRPGVGQSITGNDDIDARIRAYAFKPAQVV